MSDVNCQDSVSHKHTESAEQGFNTTPALAEKVSHESNSYNKDSYKACQTALHSADNPNSIANTPNLPELQFSPYTNNNSHISDLVYRQSNTDKVSNIHPLDMIGTTNNIGDNSAAIQTATAMLEQQANTAGTPLNSAINQFNQGETQNTAAGIKNVHPASPYGFPETSPDMQQIPGLQNSAEVQPGLFRGANPGGSGDGSVWSPNQLISNLVNLKYNYGVNTDVSFEEANDLAKTDYSVAGKIAAEQAACNLLGMKFVNIPIDQQTVGPQLSEAANQFLNVVNTPGAIVFGHCREGIDRTGFMMAQAEMASPQQMPVQDAANTQVDHGYGQAKQADYTNVQLPGANYTQAIAQMPWTETSKS